MKSKDTIRRLQEIANDTARSLDDRIEEIFNIRETEDWAKDLDIECFRILIGQIKTEEAIATHVRELLQLYVLLAETFVASETFRPLEQLSFDVRGILRDERIAWVVINETVPRIIDALECSVYNHERYRLLSDYLTIAFRNEKLDKELKGCIRHFLKLRLLLDAPDSWQDHILTKEMQPAITSMFTSGELLKIILNPSIGHLKCDPIEYTCRWEEIYYDVEDYLNNRFANAPRQMGFCFMYWSAKRDYLKDHYNIDWHSPAQMNPQVMFD